VAPSTTTTTAPAASSSTSSSTLAWAPPTLSNPITVNVSDSTPYWLATFDDTRDYIVKLPATTALHHGIGITGGHHVVLIGGEIAIPSTTTDPEYRVGIKLRNQTGTVHIEGLKITNASDGINMQQQKNATVQLENLYIETPTAYENSDGSGFHADIIQTWAGPTVLRIDHLTGKSAFQGLFFDPNDPNFAPHPAPAQFDLRNINIDSNGSGSGYNYETVTRNTPWTLTGTNIYGTNPTGHVVYTGYGPFPAVTTGHPTSDYVATTTAGTGYQSPGYN
jgi:hypothetical protein